MRDFKTKKEIAEKLGINGVILEQIIFELRKRDWINNWSRRENGILKYDYNKIVKFIAEEGKDEEGKY